MRFGKVVPAVFFSLLSFISDTPKCFTGLLQPWLRSHHFAGAKGASVFTLAAVMGRGIKKEIKCHFAAL